jgi:hypothetical protein
MKVVDFLRKSLSEESLIHNKAEYTDCTRASIQYYFPDILYDKGSWVVHVEVDEEQHKTYSCECKRIFDLAQSRLETSTLLIRYNPDAVHIDGSTWRWRQKDRLQALLHLVRWALTDHGGEAARRAWQTGHVLCFYLFYDDMCCVDKKGVWPGQVRYLEVSSEGDYTSQQVQPWSIGYSP